MPIAALWLTRHLPKTGDINLPQLGPWELAQKRDTWVFALTALAWTIRREPFGGWNDYLDMPTSNDVSVAFVAVVMLFLLPDGKGSRLMSWDTAVTIPWGVLLMFAGGITIASAFTESGLSALLAGSISGISALPVDVIIGFIALSFSFLTEAISNTASTTLLMPVLAAAAAAVGAGLEPAILMVRAVMSASCGFMLPVATAPNSLIYGSGLLRAIDMARESFILNLEGALVITAVCYLRLTRRP